MTLRDSVECLHCFDIYNIDANKKVCSIHCADIMYYNNVTQSDEVIFNSDSETLTTKISHLPSASHDKSDTTDEISFQSK